MMKSGCKMKFLEFAYIRFLNNIIFACIDRCGRKVLGPLSKNLFSKYGNTIFIYLPPCRLEQKHWLSLVIWFKLRSPTKLVLINWFNTTQKSLEGIILTWFLSLGIAGHYLRTKNRLKVIGPMGSSSLYFVLSISYANT